VTTPEPPASTSRQQPEYSERLWPSRPTWLLVPGAAAGAFVSLLPVGATAGVVAAVVAAAAVLAGLAAASTTVAVSGGRLHAGRASVPLRVLGDVAWASGEDARQERGPRLDARAYLCIRGWVDPVVRVHLVDPDDPTPYWLVSTRHPERLAAAVRAGRIEGPGAADD
jgi:hypothetical protein